MKLKLASVAAALLLGTACSSTSTYDIPAEYGENPWTNPEVMKKSMEMEAPGPAHMDMAKAEGNWKVTAKWWPTADGDPQPWEHTSNVKMILDGRFMMEEVSGDYEGMPFKGIFLMGYNNLTHEYETLWISNMSSGFHTTHGTEIAKGEIHLTGIKRDIFTPDGRPTRTKTKKISDDKMMMMMFDTAPDGTEFKNIEMTYTR